MPSICCAGCEKPISVLSEPMLEVRQGEQTIGFLHPNSKECRILYNEKLYVMYGRLMGDLYSNLDASADMFCSRNNSVIPFS